MRNFYEMEEAVNQCVRGGRPMSLGSLVFQGSDKTDIQTIKEETNIRYHGGYCSGCGKRIVFTHSMAVELAWAMHKRGVRPEEHKKVLPVRFATWLLKKHKAQYS